MLVASLGCDKAKNPTAPEKSAIAENETELTDAAAKTSRTAIKVPDDYATIQAAVDAANPGDKIVVKASGSPYNEIVTINSSKTGIHLTAHGAVTLNGRIAISADNVKIDHFKIIVVQPTSAGGIRVWDTSGRTVSGVKISHNTITGNAVQSRGIELYDVKNCLVTKNTCTGHQLNGIVMFYATDNTITRNTCTGNSQGLGLVFSDNNDISFNAFSSNSGRGIDVNNGSDGNKVKNNVCNRNDEGITVSLNSNNNLFGPGNTANFNNRYGITLFPGISGNTVRKSDFHCNTSGDIFDLGTDTKFVKNSTGPLPECQ
ncbi:MAG: right-handed parallel beta-helix repeat-containing protein [bacterium]